MSKISNLRKLLTMTRDEARNISILGRERRMLLDGVETLNDFKHNIEHYANLCDCIESQLHKTVKYYHGNPYYLDKNDVFDIQLSMHSMCDYVGYELYQIYIAYSSGLVICVLKIKSRYILCAVLTSHPNRSMYLRTIDCLVVSTLDSVGLNFERTGICFLCLIVLCFRLFVMLLLLTCDQDHGQISRLILP